MASSVGGIWAIDIGTCTLKAVRLRQGDNGLEAIGFDCVEHSKILSGPGVNAQEKQEIISQTLRQFLSQNDLSKEPIAISIAGQNSFARFIKVPPVEPKKIPEIVQYEAVQQIPFDMNEVEWDWQKMDTPDAEVGIFAIKNELIGEIIDHFTHENLRVTCVQIAPMALYNYLSYDQQGLLAGPKATIILEMGADNSTLVICSKDSVWQRNIRIGGNAFTQAIADAFKLSFEKAEKLKRSAPISKYMRQIYTAMKPVYTELSNEMQRSMGFYASSGPGRDKGFTQIIALGGGMKLQGLTKYLQQSLGIPVVKPESFERLKPSAEISAAKFHENLFDYGIVYGLGVQLMEQAKIVVNLLPKRLARAMAWNQKAKMMTIAAGILVLISLISLGSTYRNLAQYNANNSSRQEVKQILSQANDAIQKIGQLDSEKQPLIDQTQKYFDRFKFRDIIPQLNEEIIVCLPSKNNTPDQADLFNAYENGDVAAVKAVPRIQRKQLFVTRVFIQFAQDLNTTDFPDISIQSTPGMGGMDMMMQMNTPATEAMLPPELMGPQPDMMMGPDMMGAGAAAPAEVKSGFVVIIEGYSPYKRITELLDPSGVAGDIIRGGIVTRFENLSKILKDSPFELFQKNDTKHFKIETDYVVASQTAGGAGSTGKQPAGIGIPQEARRVPITENQPQIPGMAGGMPPMEMGMEGMPGVPGGLGGTVIDRISVEQVLIDPFTGEEMSKTYDLITQQDLDKNSELAEKDLGRKKFDTFGKEKFVERDSWFRIKAKFVWKNAPAAAAAPAAASPSNPAFGF